MKKILSVLLIAVTVSNAYACEICGCGTSSNYFGIIPNYNKHYLGVQYRQRIFTSFHLPEGTLPGKVSNDLFSTIELRAKYNLKARWQLFAVLPLQTFRQTIDQQTTRFTGAGDMSVSVAYTLLNTSWSPDKVRHILQAAAGVKLPTGKHDLRNAGEKINMNLQPGSGSFDIPLAIMYNAKLKNFGLNAELNYRINTYNAANEAFGNRINFATNFIYRRNIGEITFMPHAGASFERASQDFDGVELNTYSGGNAFNLIVGADVYYKNLSLGFAAQKVLSSSLGSGRIMPGNSFNVSLGINL